MSCFTLLDINQLWDFNTLIEQRRFFGVRLTDGHNTTQAL